MRTEPPTIDLHLHAAEDLRYIRRAMDGSARFTAVSGMGSIGVGVIAVGTAWVAGRARTPGDWLVVWVTAATLAFALSVAAAAWKSRRSGPPVLSLPGRRFLMALAPSLVAGALLTPVLYRAGALEALPAMWLLLYGAGVVAAGVHSITVVPSMGLAFMAAGALALLAPAGSRDLVMVGGFGGLHLAFGALIAWRHGG